MDKLFESGSMELAGHLARPRSAPGHSVPGLVICHGLPSGPGAGRLSARSFPELADRIATEMGWKVLVFTFRGCGDSAGEFSFRGWLEDCLAAIAFLRTQPDVGGVWTAGFGTGGAISICAAARDPGVRGVASISAPADFDDWVNHPRRLLQHVRELGIIQGTASPVGFDSWARDAREVRATTCVRQLAPRPLLVLHGSEDDAVPVFDARVLADAHGDADLRIIEGGAHQLRHDPRAIAVLLGWLDRQRNFAAATRVASSDGSGAFAGDVPDGATPTVVPLPANLPPPPHASP